jgi:hypothetical protein
MIAEDSSIERRLQRCRISDWAFDHVKAEVVPFDGDPFSTMVLYAVAWQRAPQSIIATIDGLKAVSYPQDGSWECRFGGRCSTKGHLGAAGVTADMRMA